MARYIDADKMREDWLNNGENECIYDTNAVLDGIDSQPTADVVEVRHGKWEVKWHNSVSGRGRERHYATFRCSECKRWNGTHRQRYCPNCGACMDGKDINVPTTDERSDT